MDNHIENFVAGGTDPEFEDALLGLELLLPLLLLELVLLEPFPVATEETCVVLVPVACGFYSPISGSRKHIWPSETYHTLGTSRLAGSGNVLFRQRYPEPNDPAPTASDRQQNAGPEKPGS